MKKKYFIITNFVLIVTLVLGYYYFESLNIKNTKEKIQVSSGSKNNINRTSSLLESIEKVEEVLDKKKIVLSEFEKEKLLKYSAANDDKKMYQDLQTQGFDKFYGVIFGDGRNINNTTEKISFLYLCNIYAVDGKEKFNKNLIDVTFPKEVLSELGKSESLNYFVDKCKGKEVGILKGFESEAEFGCNSRIIYYNEIIGNISSKDLYDLLYSENSFAVNEIKGQSEKRYYNFLKDVLSGVAISKESCVDYLK